MKTNFLVKQFLIMLLVFTGCSKYSTCILWQTGDGGFDWQNFENIKTEHNFSWSDRYCNVKTEVLMDRDSKFYSRQMVKRMIDTLLHYTNDIERIEIKPARGGFDNTKRKGIYAIKIAYPLNTIIMGLVLFDGSQLLLPPYPEQIIEIRKNVEIADSIQEKRRSKRSAIIDNFFTKEEFTAHNLFLEGYWKYSWQAPTHGRYF